MTAPVWPQSSSIPNAITQFLTMATTALPAGTTVWFGEELPAYSAPLTLQITEVTGDQQPATIGLSYLREESFQLVCLLTWYQGGPQDFVTCLGNVMTNFALLSEAVGDNPTLNNAVRFAQVGNFIITPATDQNGQTAVTLSFALRCEQRVVSLSNEGE